MPEPGDDGRFFAELRACTAGLARIAGGDLDRPVPACPGWTLRQLATHVGRGHRWAAQIVATRATAPVATRDVPDGKLPEDPARHGPWLNESADLVVEAVTAAGDDPVWTFTGPRPARWWARRRAHEAAVHLADAQLAAGQDVDLAPEFAADGVDEWLSLVVAGAADPARARELGGDGQSLHFHATDPGLSGTGEWLVTRTPDGVTVEAGHAKADVAVRGPAARLLLVLTRRLPASDPAVEVLGEQALLTHWLEHTPFLQVQPGTGFRGAVHGMAAPHRVQLGQRDRCGYRPSEQGACLGGGQRPDLDVGQAAARPYDGRVQLAQVLVGGDGHQHLPPLAQHPVWLDRPAQYGRLRRQQ